MAGGYPKSVWKILLVVAAILIALGLFALLQRGQ
jgi:hypothetical protein